MKHKLVFIEGVSGVGKTTTASLLRDELANTGVPCVCYAEGDSDNPLAAFAGTYPPPIPLDEFSETYVNCWRRFAEEQPERTYIFDGTLLHHQVNDMLRMFSASDETIAHHLTVLLKIIQPLNPIVFYLASHDVAQRLQLARESREQTAPTSEKITFWENRKRVDLFVLSRVPVDSFILNVDDGWDAALQRIAGHIMNNQA